MYWRTRFGTNTVILLLVSTLISAAGAQPHNYNQEPIKYDGDGGDLQQVINRTPAGATIVCDSTRQYTFREPLLIDRPLTLQGLNARLPEKLGHTSLIIATSEDVVLREIELHGNYDSVNQSARSPLMSVHGDRFCVEDCRFYDGTKDGVMIEPNDPDACLVGGVVRNIAAYRMGRDAVSISGGNNGGKVRDVIVENVSLKVGYHRGAVEVSDGTDNITVKNVYVEKCIYGVDVQDHGGRSAPNTNILVEDVEAVDCRHIIRTANSPRDHAGLTLKNLVGARCERPVVIANTKNVKIDGLRISGHTLSGRKPVQLVNCQNVELMNLKINDIDYAKEMIALKKCRNVTIQAGQEDFSTESPADSTCVEEFKCSENATGPQKRSAGLERWLRLWQSNWDTPLSYVSFRTKFRYSQLQGIGYEEGVGRRDPSGVIRVGDLYYVWYTRIEGGPRPVGFTKANKTLRATTWDLATIWYATSLDGINWTEQGEAIPLGPEGEFDDRSVFTPDVLVANGRYYLFYQAVSAPYTQKTRNVIAMSWADSPNGPWSRNREPILRTGEPGQWVDESEVKQFEDFGWPIIAPSEWDGHKVHDPTLIVRDGKYFLYYKGQPMGENMRHPERRRADRKWNLPIAQGVAIADTPEGPYVKSSLNPLIPAGHEAVFWPYGEGVCSLLTQGPEAGTVQYAPNGFDFYVMSHVENPPVAAGVFRSNGFADATKKPGKGLGWGLCHVVQPRKTRWPYLLRFDCDPAITDANSDR